MVPKYLLRKATTYDTYVKKRMECDGHVKREKENNQAKASPRIYLFGFFS